MNVLFVCSDNTVLSIMAESILKSAGGARFGVYSGGCAPRESVDEYVLDLLRVHRMPVSGLHPKGLAQFRERGSVSLDFVITLCDLAAEEPWNDLPGSPFVAHWSVEYPETPLLASPEAAIRDSFWTLRRRLGIFASLPQGKLSRRVLHRRALTLQPSYL